MGRYLRDVQEVTLKVVRWGLLRDPLGENNGIRGVKIGIVDKRKSGLALEKGHTKLIVQCPVLLGTGNMTKGMRNLSGYADW